MVELWGGDVQEAGVMANIDMNPITVLNTVAAARKNVRSGPARLLTIEADNSLTGNGQVWLKIYNIIDSTLVAGTSRPVIGFPIPAQSGNPEAGFVVCEILGAGVHFDEGISLLASKEDGDACTTAPDGNLTVYLTTS